MSASESYKVRLYSLCHLELLLITSHPEARLSEHSLDTSHIANINILLSSMDFFAPVNAIYQTYFGSSPASRACVAVDMPDQPFRVKLESIAYAEKSPLDRQALHVQGLSYWAPANIGPYSQAVIVSISLYFSYLTNKIVDHM